MFIKAATPWRTNAAMIEDVVALGYIKPDNEVIDLTYGGGKWWTNYRPPLLWANLPPDHKFDVLCDTLPFKAWLCRDYTDMDAWSGMTSTFDVTLFDPPYVSMGGRATSGLTDFMARFGLKDASPSPELLHAYNFEGMRTAAAITKPGGFVMTKLTDYISSGRFKPATHWMYDQAVNELGFTLHDRLIMVTGGGAQPARFSDCGRCAGTGECSDTQGITMCAACSATGKVRNPQRHARNNYSMLYIFKTPRRRA